ncbi:MAG: SAM-dependent methyltransferase [Peptostreptococcaceae bacterium]|nr:SAM-dependent methyltransferase [Peptostreptococcaceae bacterium]
MEQIKEILKNILEEKKLIKMVFGSARKKTIPYHKIIIRPIIIKDQFYYQVEYHYKDKVIHENLNPEDLILLCCDFMIMDFKQLNIYAINEDIQILAANPNDPKVLKSKPSKKKVDLSHNKKKQYIIPDNEPCDFLIRLGVSDYNGKVFQKHYSKFRQINKFLEIVDDSFESLDTSKTIKVIDFGCGKAYLTFALYHYLRIIKGLDVEIIGLDLKEDVIEFCNKIAQELEFDKLKFLIGNIKDYASDQADMVVTLHACDTATDFALINAVKWKSQIILSVPCCQHELFNQIKETLHAPLFKHGILKDRFTEILTDGIRGLKLEAAGYDVKMIEFTTLEHTSKNIMIKAVKSKPVATSSETEKDVKETAARKNKALKANEEYEALKKYWHINPTIDSL